MLDPVKPQLGELPLQGPKPDPRVLRQVARAADAPGMLADQLHQRRHGLEHRLLFEDEARQLAPRLAAQRVLQGIDELRHALRPGLGVAWHHPRPRPRCQLQPERVHRLAPRHEPQRPMLQHRRHVVRRQVRRQLRQIHEEDIPGPEAIDRRHALRPAHFDEAAQRQRQLRDERAAFAGEQVNGRAVVHTVGRV